MSQTYTVFSCVQQLHGNVLNHVVTLPNQLFTEKDLRERVGL